MTVNLAEVDLSASEFWMGDPYPTLKWLRNNDPVYRHPAPPGGRPFWAVTKYDDIVSISKTPSTFVSAQGIGLVEQGETRVAPPTLVDLDDPDHKWMRALVSKGFTPLTMRRLEPHVRELVTGILDRAGRLRECDFVAEIAAQLPIAVIGEMLGVPREDQHLIKEWSDAISEGIAGGSDGGFSTGALAAMGQMFGYLAQMQEDRETAPREDLVSILMQAEVDGQKLTLAERQGFFLLLEFAGNETTRNVISGGMLALSENSDQKARLINDPGLTQTAVEEMLRWTSPVTHFRRTAMRDVELGGRQLREGDWVVVYFGSGNRDEETFADADRFDVGRMTNYHIAFGGGGPHFCLGAALGRLEIRVMYEELLKRFPDVDLVGPPERTPSNFIRGFTSMPVNVGRERR